MAVGELQNLARPIRGVVLKVFAELRRRQCCRSRLALVVVAMLVSSSLCAVADAADQGTGRHERLQVAASRTLPADPDANRNERWAALSPYCAYLNMSYYSCERLSKVVFSRKEMTGTDNREFEWTVDTRSGSEGGLGASLVSPPVSRNDYSCMSLHFEPPVQPDWEIIFDWDISREMGMSGNADLRFYFFAPGDGDDHEVGDGRSSNAFRFLPVGSAAERTVGFAGWMRETKSVTEAVGELKWCYSGANASAGAQDVGRIDRLLLSNDSHEFSRPADEARLEEYCVALKIEEPFCDRLSRISFERTGKGDPVWTFDDLRYVLRLSFVSLIVSARVGRGEYSCMSLHWQPALRLGDRLLPQVFLFRNAAIMEQSRIRIWVNPGPNHIPQYDDAPGFVESVDPLEFNGNGFAYPNVSGKTGNSGGDRLLLDVTQPSTEFKVCHFGAAEVPVMGTKPDDIEKFSYIYSDTGALSVLEITPALVTTDRATIGEYCQALKMTTPNCAAVEQISFSGIGSGAAVWDPMHPEAVGNSPPSVASPPVAKGDHSCMRFHLSPPIQPQAKVNFYWSFGNSGGGFALIRAYYEPEASDSAPIFSIDHVPRSVLAGRGIPGVAGWDAPAYQIGGLVEPISALRWCYWGASAAPGPQDVGRIDRLSFGKDSEQITDRMGIEPYCTALNMRDELCARVSQIVFRSMEASTALKRNSAGSLWDYNYLRDTSGGDSRSLSPPLLNFRGSRSCMSLYFEPPLEAPLSLSFRWRASDSDEGMGLSQFGLWLNPGGGHFPGPIGDELDRLLAIPVGLGTSDYQYQQFVLQPTTELKWCQFAIRGLRPTEPGNWIDALDFADSEAVTVTDRKGIDYYCDALNMPQSGCERILHIGFEHSGGDEPAIWTPAHPAGAPEGGGVSVASPPVAAGAHSCLSLVLRTPVEARSELRFHWSVGRGGGTGASRMQLWLNPGSNDIPTVLAGVPSVIQDGDGFSAWELYSVADTAVPVDEIRWCYFGTNPEPGAQDIGRLDVFRFASNTEEIDDRGELDQYCVAAGLEGADCTDLSRIVFRIADENEAIWEISSVNIAVDNRPEFRVLSSPMVARGGESCMRMEFADSVEIAASRVVFRWSLTGPAAGRLRLYLGTEAEPEREFLRSELGEDAELLTTQLWLPRSPEAPNYVLRWCYYLPDSATSDAVGAAAFVDDISLQRLRPKFTVAAPTADNHDGENTEFLVHNLRIGVELSDESGTGMPLRDGMLPSMLGVRSVADVVYRMSEDRLRPLNWSVTVAADTSTAAVLSLYLPQTRFARTQIFQLFGDDGLLLASTMVAIAAIGDDQPLALNQLILDQGMGGLGVLPALSSEFVVPGNGLGGWGIVTTDPSLEFGMQHLAPQSLEDGNCFRLLVAENQNMVGVLIEFSWAGPPPAAGIRLGFYVGSGDQAVDYAPYLATSHSAASRLGVLTSRAEGHLLSWCIEGSAESSVSLDDWGWFGGPFRLSMIDMPSGPGIDSAANLSLSIQLFLYLQECTSGGSRSTPLCLMEDIGSLSIAALGPPFVSGEIDSDERTLIWLRLQWLAERGGLDVDGDRDYDTLDLRLILRYLAGLRGLALGSSREDEVRALLGR